MTVTESPSLVPNPALWRDLPPTYTLLPGSWVCPPELFYLSSYMRYWIYNIRTGATAPLGAAQLSYFASWFASLRSFLSSQFLSSKLKNTAKDLSSCYFSSLICFLAFLPPCHSLSMCMYMDMCVCVHIIVATLKLFEKPVGRAMYII